MVTGPHPKRIDDGSSKLVADLPHLVVCIERTARKIHHVLMPLQHYVKS